MSRTCPRECGYCHVEPPSPREGSPIDSRHFRPEEVCLPALLTSFTKGGPPSFKFYVFSPDAAEEGRRRASLSGTVPEAHPSRKRLGLASSSWRRTEPSSFFVLDPRIAQLESLVSLYVRDEASRTPLKPWEKARWWWSESKERSPIRVLGLLDFCPLQPEPMPPAYVASPFAATPPALPAPPRTTLLVCSTREVTSRRVYNTP